MRIKLKLKLNENKIWNFFTNLGEHETWHNEKIIIPNHLEPKL